MKSNSLLPHRIEKRDSAKKQNPFFDFFDTMTYIWESSKKIKKYSICSVYVHGFML